MVPARRILDVRAGVWQDEYRDGRTDSHRVSRNMHYALISFLNARPLWWGLVRRADPARETVEFTSPARCADLLAEGKADLGLIPAIELMRIPGLVALPSICIASRSEVRSVLLLSRVPFDEIRSVALDPSSRTSNALARVLLAERLGAERYREIRFDVVERSLLLGIEGHDAAVMIGDPALQVTRGEWSKKRMYRYDLVSEWSALTGEPFVFALWSGREDRLATADRVQVEQRLQESLEVGLAEIETIARNASEELSLPYDELLDYFRRALHYRFGDAERSALRRFFQLAQRHGVIEEIKDVRWWTTAEPKATHSTTF